MRPICVSLLCTVLAVPSLAAQEAPVPATPATPVDAREGRMGVGLQLTWPTYGLSGMLDLGDQLSVQAVLGTAGYGLAMTGRGHYRLQPQEHFRPYVYAEAGIWTGYGAWGSVPNFGGGGGVEIDVRRFLPEMPPVYAALEAGLNMAIYRDAFWGNGTYTRFQLGPSLHYRF